MSDARRLRRFVEAHRHREHGERTRTNHLALPQLASGLIAFKKAHLATLATTQPG